MAIENVLAVNSDVRCAHMAKVSLKAGQNWVRLESQLILIDNDTVGRPVVGCMQGTMVNPPCTLTVTANKAASFSSLVKIDGKGVCLESAKGKTNWGNVVQTPYQVNSARQELVRAE